MQFLPSDYVPTRRKSPLKVSIRIRDEGHTIRWIACKQIRNTPNASRPKFQQMRHNFHYEIEPTPRECSNTLSSADSFCHILEVFACEF
jgi:hypothetical protein